MSSERNSEEKNYVMLERNFEKSIFYQLDLSDVAKDYSFMGLPPPETLSPMADEMQQIHNRMLRSRIFSLQGDAAKADTEEQEAFKLLRNAMAEAVENMKRTPRLSALPDQIVWGEGAR